LLPEEQRNCLLYLHAVAIPEFETPDLYAYRVATRKAKQIGKVTRLLKEHAWDCGLNAAANQFPGVKKAAIDAHGRDAMEGREEIVDTPYTSICDYMSDCGFACAVPLPARGTVEDKSTASPFDWRVRLAKSAELLLESIKEETVRPLADVLKTAYKGVPHDFALTAIRDLMGTRKFKRADGSLGTLVYKHGYIVFQPDMVTDTDIPITYRYGRVMGRLPRTFQLKRPTLFSEVAVRPAAAAAAAAVAAAPVVELSASVDEALLSLDAWASLVGTRILTGADGPLAAPPPFPTGPSAQLTLNGWRWVLHHFRVGGEAVLHVAASWWMDNMWSLAQRKAVFAHLCRKEPDVYTTVERLVKDSVGKSELFHAGDLRGFTVLEGDQAIAYCRQSDGSIGRCASSIMEYVEEARGPPVDLEEGTAELYGLLAYKEGANVFKTMNKSTGRPGGAECATASNLPGKQEILRELHGLAKTRMEAALLLDDRKETAPTEAEKKKEQDAVRERYELSKKSKGSGDIDIRHIHTLNLKQICPYTEFLFRWLDRIPGSAAAAAAAPSRFFLSAVDYVRAVEAAEKAKAAGKAAKPKRVKGAAGPGKAGKK